MVACSRWGARCSCCRQCADRPVSAAVASASQRDPTSAPSIVVGVALTKSQIYLRNGQQRSLLKYQPNLYWIA